MKKYIDAKTGYEICKYTFGPERNAKLYFSTENFTPDDRYFIFQRTAAGVVLSAERPLYRANVETGEITLLADARKGRRPSFIGAARPEVAEPLCEALKRKIEAEGIHVETGRFQTHMMVDLVNDGPVTILLDSKKNF